MRVSREYKPPPTNTQQKMDMENDVIRLAGELSVAVEVIMDPNVSQQARMDAYIACEKYD